MKGHYTTFECAVHGFGSQKSLSKIRKERNPIKVPVVGKKAAKFVVVAIVVVILTDVTYCSFSLKSSTLCFYYT